MSARSHCIEELLCDEHCYDKDDPTQVPQVHIISIEIAVEFLPVLCQFVTISTRLCCLMCIHPIYASPWPLQAGVHVKAPLALLNAVLGIRMRLRRTIAPLYKLE